MTRVKPKLYLNMSPETVEEGGLIFARNMKIDDDGHLTSDYGYKNLNLSQLSGKTIVGHIVGLDNKVYLIATASNHTYIYEYDEISRTITNTLIDYITYHNGKITGCVNTNITGEKILTIAEYDGDEDVPIKHINLSYLGNAEDESIFTQAPKCPIANLKLTDTYLKTIPNGVYVFFIRYKIRKDVYTNWFLCSRPIFAGTSESTATIQGGIKYINTHKDSAKSFIFELSFIKDNSNNNLNVASYDEFQLGFIITHDEATDARVWKHFNLPTSGNVNIYFDYDNIQETDIDTLLETTYELYNVKNVASFKNKLYISNYLESDFNPSLNISNLINVGYSKLSVGNPANIHSQVTLKYNGNDSVLKGFESIGDVGYYTQLANGTSLSNLYYICVKNFLNIDISDFYKENAIDVEEVATFDLYAHVDIDPDVIVVTSLINKLYNNEVFGDDFTIAYDSSGHGFEDVGLVRNDTTYPDVYRFSYASPSHPLRNIMTCAFGVFGEIKVPSAYLDVSEGNIVPMNDDTISNYDAVAADGFMTNEVRSNVLRHLKKEISDKSRFIFGYGIITAGAETYYITINNVTKANIDNEYFVGQYGQVNYGIHNKTNSHDEDITRDIESQIATYVTSNMIGIDDNGNIVMEITDSDNNTHIVKPSAIEFVFKACEFVVTEGEEINNNNDEIYNVRFKVDLKSSTHKCFCTFSIKDSCLKITPSIVSGDAYKQQSTLMPFSTYNAYIHFVDEHNIITNGFKLSNTISVPGITDELDKFVLKYDVNNISNIPSKYKSFFISLKNVGDIIVETFGNTYADGYNIVHCLEADALLYNINDDLTLINSSGNELQVDAKYYSSGESIPSLAFGNCGFIAWKANSAYTGKVYVKISRNIANSVESKYNLIKATPYIPLKTTSSYVDVVDGFYGSYFCSVKKPSFVLSSSCYVSGNDIYYASRGNILKLTDFKGFVSVQDSNINFIRSNYNLNYLTLVEDLANHIHKVGTASDAVKQVIKVINSATLSYIYNLKSMYKDFMNKSFSGKEDNNIVKFDNTIRVSNVLSDETFNNSIFKFEATNYYNVPTDRGVIVLLFSIGNNIFVHTKGSLYKFDANQTIMASDSDITLQETEPFDAGISQILDSQYGYGGIDNKEAGCITFDSYFFYDRFSTHIFAYGGNSQIQLIDASIYKLLKYYSPTYCSTLHDDVNHRVLFNFKTLVSGTLKNLFTISYNYKAKSFVAIHDIDLTNSFAGRTRDFSYNGVSSFFELFNTDTTISNAVVPESEGLNIYKLFGDASIASDLFIHNLQTSPFNIAVVMFPANTLREVINSMKYIGETIEDYINTIENDDEENPLPTYDLIHIPKHNNVNPVKSLQIVTDTCVSNLINTTVDDTVRPDHTITDYKGFKHEIDSWNANYFRSIINSANIYNYDEDARELQPITPDLVSDNNSLVYGKYYVLVFNFIKNVPIKFEEVFINSEKY